MEKGATSMGADEFTFIGVKGGMSPVELTFRIFPLRSMIWLCKFPSFAVRWYSSLVTSVFVESFGS